MQNPSGASETELVLSPVRGPRPPRSRLGAVATVVAVAGALAAFLLFGPALTSDPTTTTGAAGDTVTVGSLQMTAGPLTPGASVFGPTLCSTVTYRNTGSAPRSFDAPHNWTLVDPSGDVTSASVLGTDSSVSAGQLAGGRTIRGDVCFDRPAAASGRYLLQFEPMGFASVRGAWTNEIG